MSAKSKKSSKIDLDNKLALIAENESQIAELEAANQKLQSNNKPSQREME